MLLDNTEAADTHKEILRHLIRRHGGLEALDEHVISVILQSVKETPTTANVLKALGKISTG